MGRKHLSGGITTRYDAPEVIVGALVQRAAIQEGHADWSDREAQRWIKQGRVHICYPQLPDEPPRPCRPARSNNDRIRDANRVLIKLTGNKIVFTRRSDGRWASVSCERFPACVPIDPTPVPVKSKKKR